MLGSDQRMRRSGEFAAAIRAGRRARCGDLVVHLDLSMANDSEHRSGVRAGFVVPRAVGSAVTRNLVRRRLRHLVRERLNQLPDGARLVVRALPGVADRTYAQLSTDVDNALTGARRRGREVPA